VHSISWTSVARDVLAPIATGAATAAAVTAGARALFDPASLVAIAGVAALGLLGFAAGYWPLARRAPESQQVARWTVAGASWAAARAAAARRC
jgi:hypothetical protein